MFVLDTNVISELRQGKPQPSAAVRAWAAQQPEHQLFLTSVAVFELELGVLLLERRTPPQGGRLRNWLDATLAAFEGRVLAFTDTAAVLCARMHVPDPRPARDAMMAGIALTHGFTVVTRNVRDFAGTGVQLLNPWEWTAHH
ncbi:MAG: VapC toxin family domain ribonuclease [Rhodoferax sp.]|nr:VapC toxin family domain ribonuclease [Rhodoferax sp.]